MSYRFKPGESVASEVKRIAKEELEAAAEALTHRGKMTVDEAVHDARKRVKKTRALLRLVGIEDTHLRDAARKLSDFRDAAAIIGTFDDLKVDLPDVRKSLEAQKTRPSPAVLKSIAQELTQAGPWTVNGDGFPAIAGGITKAVRGGNKAMQRARQDPIPENFHEWRKRVKDQWYHVRLLEPLWPEVMEGYEKSLKELEDWLGNDHNLTVLDEKTKNVALSERIEQEKKHLRDMALALGPRVYSEKPRRFTQRIERLWDAWQAQA